MSSRSRSNFSDSSCWQGRKLPLLMFGVWLVACLLIVGVSLGLAGDSIQIKHLVAAQLENTHIIDITHQITRHI
ncbi:hypothetical protein VMF7928_00226 [Vibrio marisflavi CECT 7928]|uniref:Uncharacterized protein n=1 Tax=Vibrio marisflavi CECT 7928 TaxID=634439 RepID=A0ABN8DXZ2_9VIBR|nr:hypothetical protein VMF7928_00226 [Vibrio marisflavi CECT 7928]